SDDVPQAKVWSHPASPGSRGRSQRRDRTRRNGLRASVRLHVLRSRGIVHYGRLITPMSRTRIKICGITHPEDAAAAARHGADAIGMVFYPAAPRNISAERARAILRVLPPFVTPVGLFVNEEPQAILDLTAALNLRHVQ